MKSFGFADNFHVTGEEKLLYVKNIRNKLAHGENSFSEVGRNYSFFDLNKLYKAVVKYISEYCKVLCFFISSKKYLDANSNQG
jgi:hypothetical protein